MSSIQRGEEITQDKTLIIKAVLNNSKLLKETSINYKDYFLENYESDKENLIQNIKWLKTKKLLNLIIPTKEDPFTNITDDQLDEMYRECQFILSSEYLNSNIVSLLLLTTSNKIEIKALIPEMISIIFSMLEEVYNKTKIDLNIIRYLADLISHQSLRLLFSMLEHEEYIGLLQEKKESNRTYKNDMIKVLNKAGVSEEDNFFISKNKLLVNKEAPEYESAKKITSTLIKETKYYNSKINLLIFSTDYVDLLDKHFLTLNMKSQKTKTTLYPSKKYIDSILDTEDGYLQIKQGPFTNLFSQTKFKTEEYKTNLNDVGILQKEDVTFFINNFAKEGGDISTASKIFLQILTTTKTMIGDTENTLVQLPLEKYMELRGLKDKKGARTSVLKHMEELKKVQFNYKEKRKGGNDISLGGVYLFGGTGIIKNGVIMFRFNPDFLNLLNQYNIMPFINSLFTITPQKNPHSYPLGNKLLVHHNMNYSKSNSNIIKVKTLLESCPDLPKIKDLGPKGQLSQRIIEPFERDLHAIEGLKWNYCGRNKKPIDNPTTAKEFEESLIYFEFAGYPVREHKTTRKRKTPSKPSVSSTSN